jgi:hypothetical protein
VTIANFREAPAMAMDYIFQAINTCCSHLMLTTLVIKESDMSTQLPVGWTIKEDMLRPLLVFTNITKIHILTTHPFDLGNKMVRDMATAWPRLQSIQLSEAGWAGQSRVTLAGIIPLISIPTLRDLGIVINASTVEHTLDMPLVGVSNTNIRYLFLGDSLIKDAHLVAAFLSEVLPKVQIIESWDHFVVQRASVPPAQAQKYQALWNEVLCLIKTVVRIRQQERKHKGVKKKAANKTEGR